MYPRVDKAGDTLSASSALKFTRESISEKLEVWGQMKLYVDDKVVGEDKFRIQSGHYALCCEGLSIGIDSGDSLSSEYRPTFEFSGGRVIKVIFDVAKDTYVNAAQTRLVPTSL